MDNEHESYVSFDQAVILKELGFDWGAWWYYSKDSAGDYGEWMYEGFHLYTNSEIAKDSYSAPTLAVVARWLREKHCIAISVNADTATHAWVCNVLHLDSDVFFYGSNLLWDTYEQALQVGIDHALLILKNEREKETDCD